MTHMYKWQLPQNRLSGFWKQKWATNWAKEEPGHKVKNRDTEYSFPKLATISPVKNWITPMITFPPVDNEQPWAWQRKATHPSSLAANLSCYKHTFSTLKTSVSVLWINPRGQRQERPFTSQCDLSFILIHLAKSLVSLKDEMPIK